MVIPKEGVEQLRHLPEAQLEELLIQQLLCGAVHAANAHQQARLSPSRIDRSEELQDDILVRWTIVGLYLDDDPILSQPERSTSREDIHAAIGTRRRNFGLVSLEAK
jgi:hypothetical protein